MPPGPAEAVQARTFDVWLGELDAMYRELVDAAVALVPGLIAALLLLLVGWLVATAVRASIVRFGKGLDRMLQAARDRFGPSRVEPWWPISRVLAHTAYWLIIVLMVAAASRILGLPVLDVLFDQILPYLPRLLVWSLLVFAVYAASGLVSTGAAAAARAAGLSSPNLLGRLTRWMVLLFTGILAAGQIGIDVTLLVNVVSVATGVLLGGAAIAFGIGASGAAGNVIAAHQARREYRVGQRVAVGAFRGEILELTNSAIVLDTEEGRTMVPARLFNEEASILLGPEA